MSTGKQAALAILLAAFLSTSATHAMASVARATSAVALHTATHAKTHRHRLQHGTHTQRGLHPTPRIEARQTAGAPLRSAPAPRPAPARDSHPRAALPTLVRLAHQPSASGGSRLAGTLPSANGAIPEDATFIVRDTEARGAEAEFEVGEARGPPRPGPIAPLPPAFARSASFLSRAPPSIPFDPIVSSVQALPFLARPRPPQGEHGGAIQRSPRGGSQ